MKPALLGILAALTGLLWLLGLARDVDPAMMDNGLCSGAALTLSRVGLFLLLPPTLLLSLGAGGWCRRGAVLLLVLLLGGQWRGAHLDAARAAACGPEWP